MSVSWAVRSGRAVASLAPEEAEAVLAGLEAIGEQGEQFLAALEAACAEIRKAEAAGAAAKRLAAEQARLAAESCPIKVGQEVRDRGGLHGGTWWRVMRIGGRPGLPTLHCVNVLASGATGSKTWVFSRPESLLVREQGATREVPRAEELAPKIAAHLKRLEADKALGLKWYDAYASADRGKVRVRYVAYQGADLLCREDAADYLAWLDAGGVGPHWTAANADFKVAPATQEGR